MTWSDGVFPYECASKGGSFGRTTLKIWVQLCLLGFLMWATQDVTWPGEAVRCDPPDPARSGAIRPDPARSRPKRRNRPEHPP